MTVQEILDSLDGMPKDLECVIAIDQSAGFENYDYMDVYPVDRIFVEDILRAKPKARGYWNDADGDKVVFYVFP